MKRADYEDDGLCQAVNLYGERVCKKTATLKHGARCKNGCFGEGIFDFYCASCGPTVEKSLINPRWNIFCRDCGGSTLEFFGMREMI